MKLSSALEIVMNGMHHSGDFYEAHRLMVGHLKQLKKREEGRKDTELTEVQVYQEHHHQNIKDVGVAFNEDRVWVCLDGVSLFRAKAVGTHMFTEYYGR
jgi:hypothetical protein